MDLEPVVRAEGQEEDSPSLSHLLFLPNESDLGSSDIPSGPGSLCYKSGPDLDTHLESKALTVFLRLRNHLAATVLMSRSAFFLWLRP